MIIRIFHHGCDISPVLIDDAVEYHANTLTDMLLVTTIDGVQLFKLSDIHHWEVDEDA